MTAPDVPVAQLRPAFQAIPEDVAHHGTEAPTPQSVYVVPGHESALNPDTPVVVGDRGTGKSFWSASLNDEAARRVISRQLKRLRLDRVCVGWGYSSEPSNRSHPSRRVLRRLLEEGHDPESIWRAVILHQLAGRGGVTLFDGADTWGERVHRVARDPETEERLFYRLDAELQERGERHLVVFDALDRLGDDWGHIRKLLQGLLRVGLDLRGYRAVRTKLFLRPDMWEDKAIWAFPDASKLTHAPVLLEWRRADLYGLLWHRLANDPQSGEVFRDWLAKAHRQRFESIEADASEVHVVPERLRTVEAAQAELLQEIASPFMGRNRRRGKTYTWLPTHLADAKGQISPRSFLVALKQAQLITEQQFGESGMLLHYEGIKRGVQEASRIRLKELQEDYPWIDKILDPLKGMTVPVATDELHSRWRENGVVRSIQAEASRLEGQNEQERPYLPPHALESRAAGQSEEDALVQAAIEIGVMNRTADGRLNIPDLFRVAAGIGRRGGVRPVR